MIAIVSRKSERGAGKRVVLLNEIHQCLLLIVSVSDRTSHLLALKAFPAEWHASGTVRLGAFRRVFTAISNFASSAALFFDVLGNSVY
jgi:hypothetical protein